MQQKSHGLGTSSAIIKAAVASALLVGGAAQAQVLPVPFTIEGKIDAIDGMNKTITVMGVDVNIITADIATAQFPETVITTPPTHGISYGQLTDLLIPLSGRDEMGFLGGTAIITADIDPQNPVINATSIFVEPAENVIVGLVTGNTGSCEADGLPTDDAIQINGINLRFLRGEPIPFDNATDANTGAAIDPCTTLAGQGGAAGGYFSARDNALYIFELEALGEPVGGVEQTFIDQAMCRSQKLEMDVRGVTTSTSGVISVYNDQTGSWIGNVDIIDDGAGGGTYRLRTNIAGNQCPNTIRADNTDGSTATADVSVK